MAGRPDGQPALFISMAYIVDGLVNKIYSNNAFNTWVFVVQVRGVQMGMI